MTTNGNDGAAPGQTRPPRCTTMARITAAIRFVALLGLLGAGMVEAWPEDSESSPYTRYIHDRIHAVQDALRHPGWSSPTALTPDPD